MKRIKLVLFTLFLCSTVITSSGYARQRKSRDKSADTTVSQSTTSKIVDLNSANESDLDKLPGIGPATARKIIAGRPYRSVDDLARAGVSARTISKIRPLVVVN